MVEVDDEVFFSLPDIRVENIITEVIDNSLDAGADSIILDLFHDISADPPSFGFAVFDNGSGFGSAASMRKAHRLGHLGDKKDYDKGMIGSFFVGFKLSTLSRFNLLSAISEHKGKLVELHAEHPDLNGLRYDVEGKENPHTNRHDSIDYVHLQKILKDEQMKTVVIGAYPRDKLLSGNAYDATRLNGRFPHHLQRFLGIIYEKYLLDGISIKVRHGSSVELEVEPIDPFWSAFTPEGLAEESVCNGSADLRAAASTLAKFGTLEGKKMTVVVEGLGELTVQPYVIPGRVARDKIKKNFTELRIGGAESKAFTGPVDTLTKVGSDILQSTNTGGIYWYREKRCINFGGTQKQNNGFYRLPGGPTRNWANTIRIKVEYGEELDSLLRLHPNKAFFRTIDDAIWRQVEHILSLDAGGEAHAAPYDEEMPFLKYDRSGRRTITLDSIWKETENRSKKIKACEHCGLVHSKGELCPDEPCSKCDKSGQGCTSKKCKYECTQCGETGHAEKNCNLNCDDCHKLGGHPPGESCPKRCSDHDESLPCQLCPCEDCSKPKGECECEKVCEDCRELEDDCLCDQDESEIVIHGPTGVDLFLHKKNREYNVDAIIKMLKHFGISIEDLEEGWTED